MFDNALVAKNAERMKLSEQLMLSELILKLEPISNKALPVVFDDGIYWPVDLHSWRGNYADLALSYSNDNTELLTLSELLLVLNGAIGQTFEGYKGGDYVMGKNTPIWIATYGTSMGFKQGVGMDDYQGVIDVVEEQTFVRIMTDLVEY